MQELLGHKDVSTTMIYARMLNKPGLAIRSPLDHQPPTRRRPPFPNWLTNVPLILVRPLCTCSAWTRHRNHRSRRLLRSLRTHLDQQHDHAIEYEWSRTHAVTESFPYRPIFELEVRSHRRNSSAAFGSRSYPANTPHEAQRLFHWSDGLDPVRATLTPDSSVFLALRCDLRVSTRSSDVPDVI